MQINLFDIGKDKKPKLTQAVKDIWYLSAIVDRYGEEVALKLFLVFDNCFNLNPNENVFANLTERNKLETVLRSTYPELVEVIDVNDELIEMAYDLIEELYETPKYRAFKVIKKVYEKLLTALEYTDLSLTKDNANISEIKKAIESCEEMDKKMSSTFKELEDEMQVRTVRGGNNTRRIKTQKELD